MNRLCTAKGIWLEGCFARGEFWLLVAVIIKVKVSAPRSSQAAAETQCWLQSHNVSLSLLARLGTPPTSQPSLLPPAAGTVLLLLCSTTSVAKLLLLLRTFSAHSALGLETRPTEMECFLMTGSTRGREGLQHWRRWCTRGQ